MPISTAEIEARQLPRARPRLLTLPRLGPGRAWIH
jgi:hypothetical protein